MVTTKRPAKQPYRPARRGNDGAWLCNVVDDCTGAAVVQASPDVLPLCSGCDVAGSEIKGNIANRQAELDAATAREETIKVAARSRADEGHDDPYSPFDHLELRAITERRQLLGGEIEALSAEHARVVAEHKHPLFACDKHASKLPH